MSLRFCTHFLLKYFEVEKIGGCKLLDLIKRLMRLKRHGTIMLSIDLYSKINQTLSDNNHTQGEYCPTIDTGFKLTFVLLKRNNSQNDGTNNIDSKRL